MLASEAYSNVLRLASNLVLARLLYPDAFGLMLIVNVVTLVLAQLSDIGIRAAVIARTASIDDEYLDSVWTVGLARGLSLATITALLAYPVAKFYGDERLAPLLLIAALTPALQALGSPRGVVFEKNLRLIRPTIAGAVGGTITTILVLLLIWWHPTVWMLAANGVVSAVVGAVVSYATYPGRLPRLRWDREVVREIVQFGRWVIVATAVSFLARQGDQLIVSKALTVAQLGAFSIASGLSKVVDQLVSRLNWSVLFPAYAEARRGDLDTLRTTLRRMKISMFAFSAPMILILALAGRDLAALLYDARYADVGWILEFLALGALFFAMGAPVRALAMALGDSYRYMWQQVVSFVVLLGAIGMGSWLGGYHGVILGVTSASALEYLVVRAFVAKYQPGGLKMDLVFCGVVGAAVAVGWGLRGWPGPPG